MTAPACPSGKARHATRRQAQQVLRDHNVAGGGGESTRLRAAGGPYDSHVVIEGHPPGPDLYRPCPFHRWDRPRLTDDGRVVCGCTRDAA